MIRIRIPHHAFPELEYATSVLMNTILGLPFACESYVGVFVEVVFPEVKLQFPCIFLEDSDTGFSAKEVSSPLQPSIVFVGASGLPIVPIFGLPTLIPTEEGWL